MRKMHVRLFAVLTMLLILFCIPMSALAAQDTQEYAVSGDLDREKPSKEEIVALWQSVSQYESYYTEDPSAVFPYETGALTQDYLESGISYLNYIRYVAGLPEVQLSDELNENAQYGAVLLAAIDVLTHYPSQPEDMPDDFYSQGALAARTSNISMRSGYGKINYLQSSLKGCLADSGSNNLSTVGHRRWLLNPTLLNVGFGHARSTSEADYVVTKVFDRSGEAVNYEFISWPASGYVPNNLFTSGDPWSVTLNPSLYQKPQLSSVQVSLTQESDGQQWYFDANTGGPSSAEYAYMTVNNDGYGVSNCLIFSPGSNAVPEYSGVYTVRITGLYTHNGEPTELAYQVEIFDIGPCEHDYTYTTVEPTCQSYGYTVCSCKICGETSYSDFVWETDHTWGPWQITVEPTLQAEGEEARTCIHCGSKQLRTIEKKSFVDVPESKYYYNAVTWAVNNSITSGTGNGTTFSPDEPCTRGQVVTFLWRAAGKPEPTTTENPFSDLESNKYYYKAVLWAVENNITSGYKDGTFRPNDTCTRAQIVAFLYRFAGNPPVDSTSISYSDVGATAYYRNAVVWANENSVVFGYSDGTFRPDATCTRGQIVAFLYRYMGD